MNRFIRDINLSYLYQSNFSFILLCDYQRRNKTVIKEKRVLRRISEGLDAEKMIEQTHINPLLAAWLVCVS